MMTFKIIRFNHHPQTHEWVDVHTLTVTSREMAEIETARVVKDGTSERVLLVQVLEDWSKDDG